MFYFFFCQDQNIKTDFRQKNKTTTVQREREKCKKNISFGCFVALLK